MDGELKGGAAEQRLARRAVALVWLGVFCVSTASLFVRHSTAPSLVLAAYRKLFAAALLLPAVLGSRERRQELRSIPRKTALWCALSGVFLAIHFWTYFLSVHHTTIAASQVLTGTEVLFVAAVMYLTGQERYGAWSKAGICLALLGSVLVAYAPGGLQLGGGALFGNLCGIVCAMMLASYSLIGVRVRKGLSNSVYNLLVYGVAAAVLCILIAFSPYSFTGYGAVNYLMGFLMAVFNSLLGHSIFNWSLKYLSPTLVSVIKLFQPVFSTTWAFLLLSELPSLNQLIGG
ncbi:MAG: DMT family transporter, partial [Oscillospiraceae bacterium]|nr:DMT family transporter [Oscillospiraceae bacterium]